jgi:RNA polymerase sigma factor (TIGR02999 family)
MSDITQILLKIESGDQKASQELFSLVYEGLRKLAAARMAGERPDHTLQATALVHEAYLRLVNVQQTQSWNSRGHFFSAAAEAMRRILVDHARERKRFKRGGESQKLSLDAVELVWKPQFGDILDLQLVLEKLEAIDPQSAELVKLRCFAGQSQSEVAALMGISRSTADRCWSFARAWLYDALKSECA